VYVWKSKLELQVQDWKCKFWKCTFGNASLKIQVSKRNVSVEMMWKYCTLEKSSWTIYPTDNLV